nr:MAG TPA: DNA terminal protein [Caudoviricetes sp.]
MKKIPNIRWRKKDETALRKEINRFNRELSRAMKRTPELAGIMPKKLNFKDVQSSVQTRKDLKNFMATSALATSKSLSTPYANEKGLVLTQYDVEKAKYNVSVINKRRASERKKYKPSAERGTLGTIRQTGLAPRKLNLNKDISNWRKFSESLEREARGKFTEARANTYKDNYIKAIYQQMPQGELRKTLLNMVENMNASEMYDAFYVAPELNIEYVYDPIEANRKMVNIINSFSDILGIEAPDLSDYEFEEPDIYVPPEPTQYDE